MGSTTHLQRARTNKQEMVIVELDYYKFFDKIDPNFMYQFMSKLGFRQTMLKPVHDLNTRLRRRIRIGRHLGDPFTAELGACQGDTASLLTAHALATALVRILDHHHPNVRKGAAVDDRNLRGHENEIYEAIQASLQYERDAGLENNCSEFVAVATSAALRIRIRRNWVFEGRPIQVTTGAILVGAGGSS